MENSFRSRESTNDIRSYFRSLSIKSLSLGANTCINNRRPVTDVFVVCINEQGAEYTVTFKLQTVCADSFRFLQKIEPDNDVQVKYTQTALDLTAVARDAWLEQFLGFIQNRIKEAKKEQEIQSIKYLGNTFELNKKTVFKVISDDGEGHLGIEILGHNVMAQELKLSSHGLLDGLYSGAIRQIPNTSTRTE